MACTDGVGTKLKLAFATGRHDTVGIDLVAMNVNDLVVSGAEPLLFLDYFAAGKLDVDVAEQVIAGIAEGCRAGGLRAAGRRDRRAARLLPGGRIRPGRLLRGGGRALRPAVDGSSIAAGDVLLGLASSGFHSNGYSLVRKVFLETARLDLDAAPEGLDEPLGEALLRPTRIYVRALRKLHAAGLLKGAAHITGGGLVENPRRMLPAGAPLRLQIDTTTWTWPPLFRLIARLGDITDRGDAPDLQPRPGHDRLRGPRPRGRGRRRCWRRRARPSTAWAASPRADAPGAPVEFLE